MPNLCDLSCHHNYYHHHHTNHRNQESKQSKQNIIKSKNKERANQLTGYSVSGVTILLSLTVFLNLVAETLPQVSDAIPLLGSDAVWCVTDWQWFAFWYLDRWRGDSIYTFFQFDGLYTVSQCLFVSFKESKSLSVCYVMIFVPFFGYFESVECVSVCSRCYYPAVYNSILPPGGPSVTPDFWCCTPDRLDRVPFCCCCCCCCMPFSAHYFH